MWKRRAFWLVLWILSLVGISFFGGTVSYGFLAGVTLVPVVSWVYLSVVFFRFKVYQELESRNVVCGQTAAYFFVLKNEDKFAFAGVSMRMYSDFSTVGGVRESTEYQLLPGEEYRCGTSLTCRYRGEYEVGIKEVVVTDFFRLFRLRYRIPGRIKAIVLPKLVKLKQMKSIGDLNILAQREVQGLRRMPDIPVREYVPGDDARQIHWKATARQSKLMVREQTGEEKQGVCIMLAAKRFGKCPEEFLPPENKLLELALAVGFFFAEKQIPVTFCCGQNGLKKCGARGLEEFDALYRQAAGILFSEEEEPAETARLAERELSASRAVFFVVQKMEPEYVALADGLRQEGTEVFFYVVTDGEPKEYLRTQGLEGRIFTVAVEADLEEVL